MRTSKRKNTCEDAILPMTDDYMQQIVRHEKNYEFRRYEIAPSVKRIWFYLNAPISSIVYICEIDPARTRKPGDEPLPEDGLGNHEYNTHHKDWERFDYAYRVRSVRRLKEIIRLKEMKELYEMKSAPRSLVYVPSMLCKAVRWDEQTVLWDSKDADMMLQTEAATLTHVLETSCQGSDMKRKREREEPCDSDEGPAKRVA
ncbi:PUA-like domain-containing protein [Amanita rubescens]|nr:PUA-like domain-containing protein [Amanita rubescens]